MASHDNISLSNCNNYPIMQKGDNICSYEIEPICNKWNNSYIYNGE